MNVLSHHAKLDVLYSVSFAGRHVSPLGHIILIPNQPIFTLTP